MRHLPPLRTLLVAAAVISACGGDDGNGPGNPPAADISIVSGAAVLGFQAFDPDTITVSLAAGGSVTWRNDDNVTHTVTDTTAANAFDTGNIGSGNVDAVTFAATGEFPYKCSIHPGMRGLVIVDP